MKRLLEARDIHAYYGASHILQGVDLTVQAGESIGLLGRNGMGKTTLIRSLMGLLRSKQGTIHIQGKDCSQANPHSIARLGIAYVPEGRGVFPNLSVKENLLVSARKGHKGRQEWDYERVLHTFPRLSERLQHGGQQLSGGEQQMLSIGRALMTNPDLIILDEATEGLAPLIIAEIWQTIATIRATGVSTLIVDRNYRQVLAHTDRCVVMNKGRIVSQGLSQELAENSQALTQHLGV